MATTMSDVARTSRWDELSALPFNDSCPTAETSARLYDELQFRRAVQVYLQALPAMNMVVMRDGQAATCGGGNHVLAVFQDRPNAKTIITTANPDVIDGLAFVDLKDGPWLKTVPGRGYLVGMRLYAPTQAFFDKQWKPDDIVKVK